MKPKICSALDVKEKARWLWVWEPQMAGGPYIHHQICGPAESSDFHQS